MRGSRSAGRSRIFAWDASLRQEPEGGSPAQVQRLPQQFEEGVLEEEEKREVTKGCEDDASQLVELPLSMAISDGTIIISHMSVFLSVLIARKAN